MKTLCDLDKKEIEKQLPAIMALVNRPAYICKKCARAANQKELVCKPARIPAAGKGG
jgi:hypothetical protein